MTYFSKKLTESNAKELKNMLPGLIQKMQKMRSDSPHHIISAWPSIIGEKWAPMTKATAFHDGILTVKVKNSTSLSHLSLYEKPRLLKALNEKFPHIAIQEIRFCIG